MERLRVGRPVSGALVAMAMLAGCGGGSTGSVPTAMTPSIARHATSSSGDLLYVARSKFETYRFPELRQDQKFAVVHGDVDAGSNLSSGDVCFAASLTMDVYHHGTGQPFEELRPFGTRDSFFTDCAFDPTTDNIAASISSYDHQPLLEVFSSSSNGVSYSDPNMQEAGFVAYDASGNVFVDGYQTRTSGWLLDELPKGGGALIELSLSKQISPLLSLEWDGTYMTVMDFTTIYRLSVSGSTATVVGETLLKHVERGHVNTSFEIANGTVIGIAHNYKEKGPSIALWHYPEGGEPYKHVKTRDVAAFALSVAPTH